MVTTAGNLACTTEVVKGESKKVTWNLINWVENHEVIALSPTGCLVEIGNPKLVLRFFLQPVEKNCVTYEAVWKGYSLCAEVLRSRQNVAIKVRGKDAQYDGLYLSVEGSIVPTKSKGKIITVIEEFIHVQTMYRDHQSGIEGQPNPTPGRLLTVWKQNGVIDMEISLEITMFHFNAPSMGMGEDATLGAGAVASEEVVEAELSLMEQLKNMYSVPDNYSDLKLETKDKMTLSAHKFLLAARSPYFHKLIEDALKKKNFDGTIRMQDVNGNPLMTILHWMYTGELDENAGKVMEEVVEASIKFELTHLLKVLDKKLISICNKENMFRLYQVAQKNAMPTAMDDISAYIRENL